MRWIALALVLFAGCSSTRVSITRQYGEPVISFEFGSPTLRGSNHACSTANIPSL
jgi:hypothetical protein